MQADGRAFITQVELSSGECCTHQAVKTLCLDSVRDSLAVVAVVVVVVVVAVVAAVVVVDC